MQTRTKMTKLFKGSLIPKKIYNSKQSVSLLHRKNIDDSYDVLEATSNLANHYPRLEDLHAPSFCACPLSLASRRHSGK